MTHHNTISTVRFGDMVHNISERIPPEVIADWQRSSMQVRGAIASLLNNLDSFH